MVEVIWGMAFICEEYCVPAITVFCKRNKISDDIAGAIFIGTGLSLPVLFASFVGLFVSNTAIGVGTVVGGNIFNHLINIAVSIYVAPGQTLKLDGLVFTREMIFYFLSCLLVIWAIQGDLGYSLANTFNKDQWYQCISISWLGAVVLIVNYVAYCIIDSYFQDIWKFGQNLFEKYYKFPTHRHWWRWSARSDDSNNSDSSSGSDRAIIGSVALDMEQQNAVNNRRHNHNHNNTHNNTHNTHNNDHITSNIDDDANLSSLPSSPLPSSVPTSSSSSSSSYQRSAISLNHAAYRIFQHISSVAGAAGAVPNTTTGSHAHQQLPPRPHHHQQQHHHPSRGYGLYGVTTDQEHRRILDSSGEEESGMMYQVQSSESSGEEPIITTNNNNNNNDSHIVSVPPILFFPPTTPLATTANTNDNHHDNNTNTNESIVFPMYLRSHFYYNNDFGGCIPSTLKWKLRYFQFSPHYGLIYTIANPQTSTTDAIKGKHIHFIDLFDLNNIILANEHELEIVLALRRTQKTYCFRCIDELQYHEMVRTLHTWLEDIKYRSESELRAMACKSR